MIPLREATASGVIRVSKEAFKAVEENSTKKGPVLQTAVIASIQGAKQTSSLIPMCHPLLLTSIKVDIEELPKIYGYRLYVTENLEEKLGLRWRL